MDPIKSVALAALALVALGTDHGVGESLHFAPAPELALRKSLTVSHELSIDSIGYSRDGVTTNTEQPSGWISTWLKVTAVDRYDEVADGRPLRFARTYVELGARGKLTMQQGPGGAMQEQRAALSSPLTRRTVDFTWVPEEGDWSRAWSRYDSEEMWLAELHGDMDLLGLLPPGEVAEGDRWEVPIEVARTLLAPGGNHLITPRSTNLFARTIEVGAGGDASEVLVEGLTGQLNVSYVGTREQDGARVAVLEVEISGLRSLSDRTELWRTSMPLEERREPARLLGALVEYGLDARGELTWDLAAGHFRTLTLTGREVYTLSVSKERSDGAAPFESAQQSTFRGTMTLRFECGPPPAEGEDGSVPETGKDG